MSLGLGPEEWQAVLLSLKVAAVATLASLPLGLGVAWLLARRRSADLVGAFDVFFAPSVGALPAEAGALPAVDGGFFSAGLGGIVF